MVCRDKNAVRNMVGLEDVMGQPLAANMVKSVEMGSSSGSSSGGSMEGNPEPPRKRGLHERKLSETTDVILDLEYGKSSRRTSNLRPIGAQVWPHHWLSARLTPWTRSRWRRGDLTRTPWRHDRDFPYNAAGAHPQLCYSKAFEWFHVLDGMSIAA